MPRPSRVKYRSDQRLFYTTIRRHHYSLGGDYDKALQRFRELTRELGVEAAEPTTPRTISTLVERWQEIFDSRFELEMTFPFAEYAGATALPKLPHDLLERYAKSLVDRQLAAETISKYMRYARKVLKWGHSAGLVDRVLDRPNLPTPVRNPKDIDQVTFDTAFAYLRASKRSRRGFYILTFIAETGCRPGEARKLEWEDVRLADRFCILPKHKTARRGKARVIVLNTRARAVIRLLAWMARQAIEPSWPTADRARIKLTGAVFLSSRLKPYSQHGLRTVTHRLAFYPYQLRHTWAQTSELPDATIAAAMGHSDLRTIQVYRHVKPAALIAAVSAASVRSRPLPLAQGPSGPALPTPAGDSTAAPKIHVPRAKRHPRSSARTEADPTA